MSRKLDGLSKLRKGLHKVAIHHRDAKLEGEEACNNMHDLVQTEQNKIPEQHRNSFTQPPKQNDRKSWQEYEHMCAKARKTAARAAKEANGRAALQQDNAYKSNTQQSRNR